MLTNLFNSNLEILRQQESFDFKFLDENVNAVISDSGHNLISADFIIGLEYNARILYIGATRGGGDTCFRSPLHRLH